MAVATWSVLIGHPALKRSSRSCKHAPTVGRGRSQWGREEYPDAAVSRGPIPEPAALTRSPGLEC